MIKNTHQFSFIQTILTLVIALTAAGKGTETLKATPDKKTEPAENIVPIQRDKARQAEAAAAAQIIVRLANESERPLAAEQLQPLVRLLWSDWEGADEAVKAFRKIGPKAVAAVDAILPGTIDESTPMLWTFGQNRPVGEFHRNALKAIGSAAVPPLVEAIGDEQTGSDLRVNALKVLSALRPDPKDRELYIKTMLALRDGEDTRSPWAITGLANLGYRDLWQAIPVLTKSERARKTTSNSLNLALHGIKPIINQAIEDGVPTSSWWTPKLRDRLLESLGDENAPMFGPSAEIIRLFVLAKDDTITPKLRGYVRHAKPEGLAAVSAWALGELGRREALQDILDLLTRIDHGDLFQEEFSPIYAVGKLGGKEVVPVLIDMLKKDHGIPANAALSLGQIGDKSALEPIRELFERSLKGGARLDYLMTAMIMLGEDHAVDKAVEAIFLPGREWGRSGPDNLINAILDLENIDLKHRAIRLLMTGYSHPKPGVHPSVRPSIREVFAIRFGLDEGGNIEAHELRQWWESNQRRFREGE